MGESLTEPQLGGIRSLSLQEFISVPAPMNENE